MISAPVLLDASHRLDSFESGNAALDSWLKRRALANQNTGSSRTYVISDHLEVAGYYALATGSVAAAETPGRIKRNMPDPIPVMILARLAVDRRWQGQGLGADLLRDAVIRTVQAARIAGIRAMLVHAIDDKAGRFYERFGFVPSPIRPLTYMLLLPREADFDPL